MAQRPVLDDAKKGFILGVVSAGCSRRTAARFVGCAVSTIANTARRDAEFARKLREMEHGTEVTLMRRIKQAAEKEQYWRAAAWALERKNPHDYAPRRPDVITAEQMVHILREFAQIIVAEVPVAKYRKNIVKQLDQMTARLRRERKE
jgi:hypothetical protein